MTSESKGITHGNTYGPLLSLIKRKVQFRVKLGIQIMEINRRRDNIILNCQNTSNCLHCTGSSQQMPRHGFGRTDIQMISMLAESPSTRKSGSTAWIISEETSIRRLTQPSTQTVWGSRGVESDASGMFHRNA